MDKWEQMVRERLDALRIEDPVKAEQLARVLERLLESEAELAEIEKRDRREESRMRTYGVKR